MICNKCGAEVHSSAAFCENCGTAVEQPAMEFDTPAAPRDNVILGTVGALMGGLIGAAVILLLGRLNTVAAIGGFVLAFCALKGYELLGKGLSVKGIVISVIIMLIIPFVADTLDWGILIYTDFIDAGYEISYLEAVQLLPVCLEEGVIEMGDYVKSLLMLYGFTALGAVTVVLDAIKKNKK